MRPTALTPAALTLVAALLLSGATPGPDDAPLTLDDFPAVTDSMLTGVLTVRDYSESAPFFTARQYDPAYVTKQLGQVEQQQDETAVTLASDILFTVDGSKLS